MIAAATQMTLDNQPHQFSVRLSGASVTALRMAIAQRRAELILRIRASERSTQSDSVSGVLESDRLELEELDRARLELSSLTPVLPRRPR